MKKLTAVLLLTTMLMACATVPGTGRRQFMMYSAAEEAAMGAQAFNEIKSKSKIITTGTQAAQVKRVGQNLAKHAGVNYNWEFILINASDVNAFCLPGGKVAVYAGILPIAQTDTGLAVVMGHEIAHALARHGAERMSQNSVVNMGGQLLGIGTGNSNILSAYGAAVNLGVLLPYSRKHESEADYMGLMLMARAGYDPREAVNFWQRMSAASSGKTTEFLSTHPSDAKRIADIQKNLTQAMQYYIGAGGKY
ncbi:putative Zn-dependent protease [Elusimicrobium simillimum]|uniref:M48 family metallopeptidase n=1 Tax=Elusimicrobium simillimum TaxID=3143438 RepID=UPI003C703702